MDRKIAAGLMLICHGELGRELTQMSTTMYNNDQIVRGRSLLAVVFRYYASSNSGQVLYDLNHLQGLRMVGDNVEGFHNAWNMVMAELSSTPAEETLQYLYYQQVKDFKPMAADVARFLRAEWNSGPEHCFQWLWDATCRYIKQRRRDHMQDSLNKSLHNRNHNDAAPGVVPSGRGKGDRPKGNDRAAAKSRSATPNRTPQGGDRGQSKCAPRGRPTNNLPQATTRY